ncbi:unnamed protein product [Rangifer tarandus platyrhynchus]|uniref:Uncharacterized protein n=1 Tax=Rangifer tarandus platyrhynchus TaxID=3082113 RepID=A0AC60A5M3_RANTA
MRLGGSRRDLCLGGTLGLPPSLPNSMEALTKREGVDWVPREMFLGRLLARGLLPARPHRRRVSGQPRAWRELVLPLLFSLSVSPDLLKHDSNLLEAGGTVMKNVGGTPRGRAEGREGGRERGLEEGSAPERRGPRQRRSAAAAEAIPRIPSSKHLLGVFGGLGVGAAAPTLARPGCAQAAVGSEPPPHSAPRAPSAAPRARLGAIGSPASEARPPSRPALRLPSPGLLHLRGAPGAAGLLSAAVPRSPACLRGAWARRRRRGEAAGGERRRGPRRPEPRGKWHARALEAEVAEAAAGRRCSGSVGEEGESEPGEPGARAPAGCGEARAAPRLRPPHPRAPTLRATGPGSGSRRRRRRRRHPENGAKVWIWGRTRRRAGFLPGPPGDLQNLRRLQIELNQEARGLIRTDLTDHRRNSASLVGPLLAADNLASLVAWVENSSY